jgi:hypothetical protein
VCDERRWHAASNQAEATQELRRRKKMKKQLIKASMMLIAITTLAFVTAMVSNAQAKGHRLSANVPFSFMVGDKTLRAGQYNIGQITQASDAGILVRSADTEQNAIRLTNSIQDARAPRQSMLVFRRYGEKYYLAQIWTEGKQEGRELLKSKSGRALERELAASPELASTVRQETVTIIASVQ